MSPSPRLSLGRERHRAWVVRSVRQPVTLRCRAVAQDVPHKGSPARLSRAVRTCARRARRPGPVQWRWRPPSSSRGLGPRRRHLLGGADACPARVRRPSRDARARPLRGHGRCVLDCQTSGGGTAPRGPALPPHPAAGRRAWERPRTPRGRPSSAAVRRGHQIRDHAELNALFGNQGQRHWTRQGLPDRIAEIDALVPQDGEGDLRARYDDDTGSRTCFSTAGRSLSTRASRPSASPRRRDDPGGPSEQHLANGLRHAYWSYERLVRLAARRRAPELTGSVEDTFGAAWPVLQKIRGPALKATGCNGSCPCGSKRTTKDCHGAL